MSPVDEDGKIVNIEYKQAGTYEIKVRVDDNQGRKNTMTCPVEVIEGMVQILPIFS